jgi:hypothetical protein
MRRITKDNEFLRYTLPTLPLAVIVMLSLLAAACSSAGKGYPFKPEFSVNIAKVDPRIAKLSLAEQEMLKIRGQPDWVHIWWMPNGEIVDAMTVRRTNEGKREGMSRSWIYLEENEEIVFLDQTHFRTLPLTDELRCVCELGDPQEIRRIPDSQGRLAEQWRYYNRGRFITFVNGIKVKEDLTAPMPHYLTK